MNDQAHLLLSAYRSDSGPTPDREDALFSAIVRRIVTEDAPDLDDEEVDEAHDEVDEEPEAEAEARPRRGRRAIVLPVALATAALAAGIVLALSLRSEVLTPVHDDASWQAPSTDERAPWWERIVPKTLLDGVEEEAVEDAPDGGSEPGPSGAVVPSRPAGATTAKSSGRGTASRASSGPAAVEPAPTPAAAATKQASAAWVPTAGDGPPRPSTKPRTNQYAGGAGLPGGGGSSAPKKKDDEGGSGKRGSKPSGPKPSGPRNPGGPRGPGGPGTEPPPMPPPPDPGDEPPPVPESCEEQHAVCLDAGVPVSDCNDALNSCLGDPCEQEYFSCLESAPAEACEDVLMECQAGPPGFMQCIDNYEACFLEGIEPNDCLLEYIDCGLGTPAFLGECDAVELSCDALGSMDCDQIVGLCVDALLPEDACHHEHMSCVSDNPPDQSGMCDAAFDACMDAVYQDAPPEPCWTEFDECMLGEDPDLCEQIAIACSDD